MKVFMDLTLYTIWFAPAVRSTNIGGYEVLSGPQAEPYTESDHVTFTLCDKSGLYIVAISWKMQQINPSL